MKRHKGHKGKRPGELTLRYRKEISNPLAIPNPRNVFVESYPDLEIEYQWLRPYIDRYNMKFADLVMKLDPTGGDILTAWPGERAIPPNYDRVPG